MSEFQVSKTVLVTGAGGSAMPGMISTLRGLGVRIIAVDMLSNVPGFYLADKAFVVPAGDDQDFLPRLREICLSERVDAVISVVDEELPKTSALEQLGIAVLQPRDTFVSLCLDKLKCMHFLRSSGINAPKTWVVTEIPDDVSYPIFVKPRVGRGSRGCSKVESAHQLLSFIESSGYRPDQLIAQDFIEGTEYTVSVVVWRDGRVQGVVPKEIVSKVGITRIAITRKNKAIDRLCRDIQTRLIANGPFNVQLILDKTGRAWPFEINPRFSTSITLTVAAGANELGALLSQALFKTDGQDMMQWAEGVVMVRHTKDEFMTEEQFLKVQSEKINAKKTSQI